MTSSTQCQEHRDKCQKRFRSMVTIFLPVVTLVLGGLFTISIATLGETKHTSGQVELIRDWMKPQQRQQSRPTGSNTKTKNEIDFASNSNTEPEHLKRKEW